MKPASTAISVIIPMRNEESRIGACLDSVLTDQPPEGGIEILVADGCSVDSSRSIVEERSHFFNCIRLIDNPNKTVSCGINAALRQARGRVILILGAHATCPPGYLKTCLEELGRTGAAAVGGCLRTCPGGDTVMARAIASLSRHRFGVGGAAFRTGSGDRFVDTVPYGACRREVFERVGVFSEELIRNQDLEFNSRVRAAGGKLFLSSRLKVSYYNSPDFQRFMRQAFGNGRWLVRMWLSGLHSFHLRHLAPVMFVMSLVILGGLAFLSSSFAWALALILSMYCGAALISSIQITVADGWDLFPILPVLFFCFHVVYGTGTAMGLLECLTNRQAVSRTPAGCARRTMLDNQGVR